MTSTLPCSICLAQAGGATSQLTVRVHIQGGQYDEQRVVVTGCGIEADAVSAVLRQIDTDDFFRLETELL
jgi:hypothetical protein